MSRVTHPIEKEIVRAMSQEGCTDIGGIVRHSGLSEDQARRGMEWLKDKGIIRVTQEPRRVLRLGPAGIKAARSGLPERRLLSGLRRGLDTDKIRGELGDDYGPAVGICMRNGWIRMDRGQPVLAEYPEKIPGEDILAGWREGAPAEDVDMSGLARRPGFVTAHATPARYELVHHMITDDGGRGDDDDGAIDVEADVAAPHIARTHPLREIISEIREIFVTLGFTEIHGSLVQSSFWNFDALFTPQDHPAREMQDTFFVRDVQGDMDDTAQQTNQVEAIHNDRWGYSWDPARAAEPVLRTHTTCVTIRHLAENNPAEARVFSLGSVFRNEKPSYKHLVEFNQVEGVVIGDDVSLRDLMGIQREFYRRMGITRIKFWPTFFPYTEPSLQSMVYNEALGKWVELFGMGIFRPEVTEPLGITRPVLAWGGGIERMAMLKYGVDDVREFYNNSLGWLRRTPVCR